MCIHLKNKIGRALGRGQIKRDLSFIRTIEGLAVAGCDVFGWVQSFIRLCALFEHCIL